MTEKNRRSEKEWRKILTKEQFHILREKGTERAFSGKYWNHFKEGTYYCAGCRSPLFESVTKFESNCGWPSFTEPISNKVEKERDTSFEMIRTEVLCKKCGGHLGHVFDDGPKERGGLRYCINSSSLEFIEE
ncbi:MAG: peptide-methionine (R)-S-oxide reductase MsrB [Candidatus Hodarchaeota archaeon]